MSTIDENILTILRVLYESEAVAPKSMSRSELFARTCLSESDFDQAERLLFSHGYVTWPVENRTARGIIGTGTDYLHKHMAERIPLSLDAERILKYLVDSRQSEALYSEVMEKLGLDREKYIAACEYLEDFGLIRIAMQIDQRDYYAISASQEGRQTVRRNFRNSQSANTNVQAAAIFTGPVTDSNIQAVASAINSRVEQTIAESDPIALRQEIISLVENLVSKAIVTLTSEQKAAYLKVAAEFKQEITKPEPNAGILHKLQTTLSFGDTLNGTLELGQKALNQAKVVAPYIPLLVSAVVHLLNLLAPH